MKASGDSDTAVKAAIERFGDPRELTGEIQSTVPQFEAVMCRSFLDKHALDAQRQNDESAMSFSKRMTFKVWLGMVLPLTVAGVIFALIQKPEEAIGVAVFLLGFSLAVGPIMFAGLLFHQYSIEAYRQRWLLTRR